MAQFVLIHGAWHGAWCWKRVLPLLREAGHEAHAITLTGVGERAHLLAPGVGLKTHIQDAVGLVLGEELDDAVLVGHSYGGLVITGAADALLARGYRGLRRLVYVDAIVPAPGECWSSQQPPEVADARRRQARTESGGLSLPPPDSRMYGLEGADHAWVQRHLTPQPFAAYDEPLHFDEKRVAALPRTYVDCSSPALPTVAAVKQRVRAQAGWRIVEIATGHDPMVSAPRELVEALLA